MNNFLKFTFASLIGNLLAGGIIFGLTFSSLIFFIATASKEPNIKVKNKSVLVIDLSIAISDTNPAPSTGEALQATLADRSFNNNFTLRQVLDSIDSATKDRRIMAILLQGSVSPGPIGLANMKEIREALIEFKKAKKKIFAYDLEWTEKEYYLGSVADEISIHPSGAIEMNGLSAEEMFVVGALEKFGVGVQVTRAGKYKAAVEPFIRKNMSDENRQQNQKLLSDLWNNYLETVSLSRKLTVPQLQNIADNQAVLVAEQAVQSKLVDKTIYFDELVTELKKLTGKKETDKTFEQVSLGEYITLSEHYRDEALQRNRKKNQIAIIYAEGEIVDGEGTSSQVGGDRLARELRQARQNEQIKAIVFRVNSPGGSATASDVIQRELVLTKQKKPVIISMGNLAASGGYWISMGADKIFAEPNTITGSIGVFGLLMNFQKLGNTNGVTWDTIKTAKYADLETNSRPKSPAEMALIQKIIDKTYDNFINKVVVARKLPKAQVQEIAQGRIWSGIEAKAIGLVDEIGGLEMAIKAAAKQAKLGDQWILDEYPKYPSFEEQLLNRLAGAEASQKPIALDPLTKEWLKVQGQIKVLQSLNDPLGIYARLPFNLNID